jgi:hypothetical protein
LHRRDNLKQRTGSGEKNRRLHNNRQQSEEKTQGLLDSTSAAVPTNYSDFKGEGGKRQKNKKTLKHSP